MGEPAKKRRAYAPKKITGCATCRRRRISCDETAPSCKQCAKSNRVCEGYQLHVVHYRPRLFGPGVARFPSSQSAFPIQTSIAPPPTHPTITCLAPEHRVALDFYISEAAAQFTENLRCSVWRERTLQLCLEVPAVLYAVLSLSSVCRARLQCGQDNPEMGIFDRNQHRLALKQHIHALYHLQKALTPFGHELPLGDDMLEILLLSGLLFASFNLLRGERRQAISHFRESLKVLENVHQTKGNLENNDRDGAPTRHPLDALISLYRRLDGGIAYFRVQPLPAWNGGSLHLQIPEQFGQLSVAAMLLDVLATSVFQIRDLYFRRAQTEPDQRIISDADTAHDQDVFNLYEHCRARQLGNQVPELADHITILSEKIDLWAHAFGKSYPLQRPYDRALIRLLVKRAYTQFVLHTFRDPDPCFYDGFLSDYRTLLDLTEQYAEAGQSQSTAGSPEYGPDVLTAAYHVAVHCREPCIRRRAIELLRRATKHPDASKTHLLASFAERVMSLEETAAMEIQQRRNCGEVRSPATAQDVPGEARFNDVRIARKARDPHTARLLLGKCLANGQVEVTEQIFPILQNQL